MTKGEVILGYIGKPKCAQQIVFERGFFLPTGLLLDRKKIPMDGKSLNHPITGAITIDNETGVISMLK